MKKIYRMLAVLTGIMIFYFSNQPANISSMQSDFIYKLLRIDLQSMGIEIRKVAHFTIYFILGFFLALSRKRLGKQQISENILLIFLFAISDEFHQSFIPGRGPSFKDVLIDTSGAMTSTLLIYSLKKIKIWGH